MTGYEDYSTDVIKAAFVAATEELKKGIKAGQLSTVEARKKFVIRFLKDRLKAISTPKGKSRSEDRLLLRKKKAWNRTKAQKTAKMRYSPNRTTGKLIYRISHHKHFSRRLLAGGVYSVFRTHNFFSRTSSRSRRSPVRSAAKSGSDDSGGDGDSDGPGDPPGPRLTVPSLSTSPTLTTPQRNSSIPSRIVHPCYWCMERRWAA